MGAMNGATLQLAEQFAPALAARPGLSGFAVLQEGAKALLSRTALATQANDRIDLQYYIYAADHSGLTLLLHLAAAADRGVKVRLLVDDNNLAMSDVVAAQVAMHPNIEVRVFNPFVGRVRWLRPFEGLLRLKRLNRRMHNKIFAVDGCVAIVGGRNVGDAYFDAGAAGRFADVDLLAVGPVVAEAQASFDEYWHSDHAVDPAEFLRRRPASVAVARLVAQLRESLPAPPRAEPSAEECAAFIRELAANPAALAWGEARLVHDSVHKFDALGRRRSAVGALLVSQWRAARQEVLLASAYFVPRRLGVRLVRESVRRGVAVSVLTNSLAANDVALVHVGYARYRRRLLAAGARLFEFRGGPREASLHTKLAVFDREYCWVGSFNFDPRSLLLNTEVGLLVHSRELAERLVAVFAADTTPERTWELVRVFHAPPKAPLAKHRWVLGWRGQRAGADVLLEAEPDAPRWRHWLVRFAARIPGLDQVL